MKQGNQLRTSSLLLATLLVTKLLSFSPHRIELAHTLPKKESTQPFSYSNQLRAQDL